MAQTSGAFDLSAMRPAAAAPAGGSYVTEVTQESFEPTLRKSIQYPIVLEFYSAQAPESANMGAVLTELANAAGGAWLLARMNIDAAPQVVTALQIRAVPMVVGVLAGQLVPLWQGSMAKEDAARVIGELLKMATGNGILGKAEPQGPLADPADEPVEDPRYTAAYDAMGQGDYASAEQAFRALLDQNPADATAKVGKAQAGLLARVAPLDPVATIAAGDRPGAAVDDILAAADVEIASGQAAAGFARLINAIASHASAERDRLRVRLLELFDTQEPGDPAVLTARRNLTTALF